MMSQKNGHLFYVNNHKIYSVLKKQRIFMLNEATYLY
jgi:hypothetical protein